LRKKTYVFDGETLDILKILKEELGKKETQIIREALKLYFDNHRERENLLNSLSGVMDRIEKVMRQISELSYRLGKCEERNRILEEEVKRLRKGFKQ